MHRFLTLFILCISIFANSQNKFFIGIDQFTNKAIYNFFNYGNSIKHQSTTCTSGSIFFGYRMRNGLSLESAIIRNRFSNGLGLGYQVTKVSPISPILLTLNSIRIWQLPIRIKSTVDIYKTKIFLTFCVGYHFCINSDYYWLITSNWRTISQFPNTFSYTESFENLKKRFSLIETKFEIDYKITKTMILSIGSHYFIGFRNISQINTEYKFNNDPLKNASGYTKGEYYGIGIALKLLLPLKDKKK